MTAIISKCGEYRYALERKPVGAGNGSTAVIMVNPSTADATDDDPTIRKLCGFAQRNKWGWIIVGNLFAYRATDVRELGKTLDPVGLDNDMHLSDMLRIADRVVVAWGRLSKLPTPLRTRWCQVADMIQHHKHSPLCIGNPVEGGQPRHPLMPGYDTPIIPWSDPRNLGL